MSTDTDSDLEPVAKALKAKYGEQIKLIFDADDTDERLHDAVSADNVRRLLDGTLIDPMPGTLAALVDEDIREAERLAFESGLEHAR